MADALRVASHWERTDEGVFRNTIPFEWANGPGAYGGIVAASLLRQMQRVVDDPDKPARTLHVQMCAPLRWEPATMRARVDSKGRSITHAGARIEQEGELAATASATFAASTPERESLCHLEPPEIPPPEDVALAPPMPLMPEFARNFFRFSFCMGKLPMTGAEVAETGGYLSTQEPFEEGPLLASCLLDAWPPSVFPTFEEFRRTVTVDLRYQFLGTHRRKGTTDEPFLFHAKSDVVADGYAREDAELWTKERELLARAQQTYAILD